MRENGRYLADVTGANYDVIGREGGGGGLEVLAFFVCKDKEEILLKWDKTKKMTHVN